MSSAHPTVEDLNGFLRNPIGDRARSAMVVRHLLGNCSTCRERFTAIGWPGDRIERLVCLQSAHPERVPSPAEAGFDYDRVFERAQRSVAEYLAEEAPAASPVEELLAALDSLSREGQERAVQRDRRFISPQLVRQLIERSHGARYDDPEAMLHWATLARKAASQCTVEEAGSKAKLADLNGQAWGHYGNALRIAGRLREAEQAMATATACLDSGTGDPVSRARLLEQIASLRTFERRFESAIAVLDEAVEIYQDLGEPHAQARTLVQKAIAALYAGEAESAVMTLNRAIPLIDHEEDPHLLLAACHNLILCYIDLDRPQQALSLYFEAQDLYGEFKDALIMLRAAWQKGKLLYDVGHLRAAESALLRARGGFMERGLAYEVAVVSLDLAAVYVKLGKAQELKSAVADTLPIFRALQVDRETLASLIQLQQLGHQEQQALKIIRLVTAQLDNVSSRPLLK